MNLVELFLFFYYLYFTNIENDLEVFFLSIFKNFFV